MIQQVFGYVRVSTGEQGKQFSLDGQREEIRRYCEKNQYNVVQIFEDQTSGTRLLERQGLMSMIDTVDSSIFGIVATESDRLSRDVFQYGWLCTHLSMQGVKILLINECETTTPSEKAFAKVRAVFAEFETELRQARILRGIKQAKEKERFMNRPPLGYRMENKQILIDENTQSVVIEIFRLAAEGHSLNTISQRTDITRSSIHAILKNPFYIDNTKHGKHNIFLDLSLWKKIREQREYRSIN